MQTLDQQLRQAIDQKAKPLGALGDLESLAFQIGKVQKSLTPRLVNPTVLVFAGDHGAVNSGISRYPREVTFQMVNNFLQGGAGINVFCRQNEIDLFVIDAGVHHDFPANSKLINAKVDKATRNYLLEPAMTGQQLEACFSYGDRIIEQLDNSGCNIVGFGEMGIGNTSSASLIMSTICKIPIANCCGRGAGLDDLQLEHKIEVLEQAKSRHGNIDSAKQCLQTFAGFEIAMMTAAILSAYKHNMLLLVDGFISSTAYLAAVTINSAISSNAIFCHLSDEHGHKKLLDFLQCEPLLKLSMRLGEGTGCALAYPIIRCAVAFLNEMASFESAAVSTGN
jgi:nicotinate-nucleotide--dimethylbenzimidazole phosphoribosyltransferase